MQKYTYYGLGTVGLRRFWVILGGLSALVVGGTLAYHFIQGWSFLDSLYMTLITLSTVGFREVHEPSPAGQVLTIILIILGIGFFTYSGAQLVSFLVSGEIRDAFRKKRRVKMIQALQDHHIVCGCGRVGAEVVRELQRSNAPVVVVESDPEELKREVEVLEVPFVLGSATEAGILEQAGIERASSLVTCLPDDADNLYICLNARSLRKNLHIIARANHRGAEDLLKKAGADRVIFPYALTGYRMALHCVRPAVTRFLDSVSEDFRFEEIRIPEKSAMVGRTLKDSGIRQAANAIVVAILSAQGIMQPNPASDASLSADDTLILLGSNEQLQRAEQLVKQT